MRGKSFVLALLLSLFAMAEHSRAADGWVSLGNYVAEGTDIVEAEAKAEGEGVMADTVAAIAALHPGEEVIGIVDSENWDSPNYEINFTVYLRIFSP